jgi:hypothetical protein
VHSVWTIRQFANRKLRPVLTVAIGQDAVIRNWAVQAYDRIFSGVNAPDRLNNDRPLRTAGKY